MKIKKNIRALTRMGKHIEGPDRKSEISYAFYESLRSPEFRARWRNGVKLLSVSAQWRGETYVCRGNAIAKANISLDGKMWGTTFSTWGQQNQRKHFFTRTYICELSDYVFTRSRAVAKEKRTSLSILCSLHSAFIYVCIFARIFAYT